MKKKLFGIVCVMLAVYVLFISMDVHVCFHRCSENHHVTSSFGDASALCLHCAGHHHDHEKAICHDDHGAIAHFEAKCCCEDFQYEIKFADGFTFSTERPLQVFLPCLVLLDATCVVWEENYVLPVRRFTREKIPVFLSGRLMTIFFSHLKLNPLVF